MNDDDLTPHYHRLAHSAALVGEFDGRPERQAELLAWVLEAVRAIAAARGLALEAPHIRPVETWTEEEKQALPVAWEIDGDVPRLVPHPTPLVDFTAGFRAPSPALFDESEDPDLSGCAEDGPARPQFGWEHVLASIRQEERPYEVLASYADAWGHSEVLVPVVLITEARGGLSLYLPNGLPARAHGEAKALLEARGLRRLDTGVTGPTGLYYDVVPVGGAELPARSTIEAGAGFAPGELRRPDACDPAEDGGERVMQAAESWWGRQ